MTSLPSAHPVTARWKAFLAAGVVALAVSWGFAAQGLSAHEHRAALYVLV